MCLSRPIEYTAALVSRRRAVARVRHRAAASSAPFKRVFFSSKSAKGKKPGISSQIPNAIGILLLSKQRVNESEWGENPFEKSERVDERP